MKSIFRFLRRASFAAALCLPISAIFLPAPPAHATLLAELSDSRLVEFSSAICRAEIVSMTPIQMPDGAIVTAVGVDVIEWLKPADNSPKTYSFCIRGGQIGDIAQIVHGEPSLAVGQEIVAFLEYVPRYQCPMLLGMAQGAFVAETAEASPEFAQNDSIKTAKSPKAAARDDGPVCRDRQTISFKRAAKSRYSAFDAAQTPDELIEMIKTAVAKGTP